MLNNNENENYISLETRTFSLFIYERTVMYNNIQNMQIGEKSYSRLQWTFQEEKLLRNLREDQDLSSWREIAKVINKNFPNKSRTGKQCRERYINYVRFGEEAFKMTNWTHEEDLLLFSKFVEEGPKWVKIAKFLPRKSQNCLKNRFYGMIRKIIRKIQRFYRQKNKKMRKIVRPQFFAKILESKLQFQQYCGSDNQKTQQFLEKLRSNLIDFAIKCQEETQQSDDGIQEFINQIQKFYTIYKEFGVGKKHGKKQVDRKQSGENEKQFENEEKHIQSASSKEQQGMSNCMMEQQQGSGETVSKQKIVQTIIIKSPDCEPSYAAMNYIDYSYMMPYFILAASQQLCHI